ncbi:L,D-transpeptidase family protein [Micromonospora siamensis]|uniref:Peptidoglycan-binding (PGRP) domain of peptidoglycan hydrolases-containing protein n=1 Tax=Micromonospora siamensis TaxID=299152 RepID=A0A1C5IRQ7_9ACTN|nr:L,D-transpeptidase family protein [Micromonospora siamensis]SCG60671.1 Peptidoglycan-binding (PGRP) domain of peptidoglycan hydrolases-containing protein [Micromonospora siamensis]
MSPPTSRVRRAAALVALATTGGLLLPVSTAQAAPRQQAPVVTQVATQVTTELGATATARYALATTQPTLRQGSRGAAVTTLQRRLAALHYDLGTIDGDFGPSTFHAVVAFQKVNGLSRDGIVGPNTWAKLSSPVIPKPRYRHSGLSLEANLSRQVLYLARDGQVIRILDASSGKASTPTVRGNFSITRRIDGWRQSDLGMLWKPNYFYRGYAVHGATSVPNYPASHGCVRVTIPAMNRLWGTIKVGLPVHVYA